jgi:hypothetical protein
MSSMRIDGGASAKLWAKRLEKLFDLIEEDGGLTYFNSTTGHVAVDKDGQTFTTGGKGITGEF